MDVVYTWVDGENPENQKLREHYAAMVDDSTLGNQEKFFLNNDELKYSLRSLESFAPWVERVFIVSNGEIPRWLNANHSRLKLVKHEDIFQDKNYLPTFHASAIEHNLFRIPDISERFVYFNDDFILGNNTTPDDFFTEEYGEQIYLAHFGIEKRENSYWRIPVDPEQAARDLGEHPGVWALRMHYINTLFNERYGARTRLALAHIPYTINREVARRLNLEWSEEVEKTCASRFRVSTGFLYPHCYAHFLSEQKEIKSRTTIHPPPPSSLYMMIPLGASKEQLQKKFKEFDSFKPKFLCCQSLKGVTEEVRIQFKKEMEHRLPVPSVFEKEV